MSYRHIISTRIASDKLGIVRYEINSPDFNDERQWEQFGILEITFKEGMFFHCSSENWSKKKIYPIDLFMMSPLERAILVKEKYPDYASGAWAKSIADFIQKGFQSGQWKDEISLTG